MTERWMDVSTLPFHSLLLLERVQITWLEGWLPEDDLAIALGANPTVEWFLRHKCPEASDWLDTVMARATEAAADARVRKAEVSVLESLDDLMVYALNPAVYDAQPFLRWDDRELTSMVDLSDRVVLDIGAGTGRLTFVAARTARVVFAVEPVQNLRHYLRIKARERGVRNIYAMDGLVTQIPFPDHFADVVIGGHVFGDDPALEYAELARVARLGGVIALCPGNRDLDNERHCFLVGKGFAWASFEEPRDGMVRKYWKRMT